LRSVKVFIAGRQISDGFLVDDSVYIGGLPLENKTIVLDPGHGGSDRYNRGQNGYIEADGVLDIALKLKPMLKELGANVILTRDKDEYLTLYERGQIANENDADIFISLHTNAMPNNNDVQGIETYYSIDPYNESKLLAECVLNSVHKICGRKRRFARSRLNSKGNDDYYGVLRYSDTPACIVEYGYHTNPNEETLLLNEKFRLICAYATKLGILEYFKKLENKEEN